MKFPAKHNAKGLFLAFLLLYLLITLVPAAVYYAAPNGAAPSQTHQPSPGPECSPSPSPAAPPDFLSGMDLPQKNESPGPNSQVALYDTATGQEIAVDEREFLAANLACEMDLRSPEEALKAQAVAACTYYLRMRNQGREIVCDTENWLVYVPESAMRDRWGEDYETYRALLDKVLTEVSGQTLTYQGEPALTAYFAISPGSTENVENVWAEDAAAAHPYLRAVASPGDALCDGYLSTASFTPDELRGLALQHFAGDPPDLSGPAEGWLAELEYTPSGMVESAVLGGKNVRGTELRAALGLRSASFTVEYSGEEFRFTVKGWGHGVGMSQAGAVFMAKRGAGYQEILAHYYPGTTLAAARK